jgi:hypothetical protein
MRHRAAESRSNPLLLAICFAITQLKLCTMHSFLQRMCQRAMWFALGNCAKPVPQASRPQNFSTIAYADSARVRPEWLQ